MVRCAVPGCLGDSNDASLATFTLSKKRRDSWLTACGLPASTSECARICEGHFSADQLDIKDSGKVYVKPGACPTIFVCGRPQTKKETVVRAFPVFVDDSGNTQYATYKKYNLKDTSVSSSSPASSSSSAAVSSQQPLRDVTSTVNQAAAPSTSSVCTQEPLQDMTSFTGDKTSLDTLVCHNGVMTSVAGLLEENKRLAEENLELRMKIALMMGELDLLRCGKKRRRPSRGM